ncbi:hypothetical protein ANCCEY_08666 [Ancylostoma ceylanicum]|uniref:Uncharacterized protein n=1 Tax=Ancylostoma ceylanicum TaxID=53326 RepID=A0A0D6LX66_9BILA|nr:hypothetical protein ANCCEY_08666 [Ancylostoma ceylanicum]
MSGGEFAPWVVGAGDAMLKESSLLVDRLVVVKERSKLTHITSTNSLNAFRVEIAQTFCQIHILCNTIEREPSGGAIVDGACIVEGASIVEGAPIVEGASIVEGAPIIEGAAIEEGASTVGAPIEEGASTVGAPIEEGASTVGAPIEEGASPVGPAIIEGVIIADGAASPPG